MRTSWSQFIEYITQDMSPSSRHFRHALGICETAKTQAQLNGAIRGKLIEAMQASVAAIEHRLVQEPDAIDQIALLGADVLLDEDGHAWLLEFTKGPAFRFSPEHMAKLHGGLCQELLDAMLEIHDARQTNTAWHKNGQSFLGSLNNFVQVTRFPALGNLLLFLECVRFCVCVYMRTCFSAEIFGLCGVFGSLFVRLYVWSL